MVQWKGLHHVTKPFFFNFSLTRYIHNNNGYKMGGSYLKQIYVSNDGRYKITATMAYIYKKSGLN